ncbi:hypothetical protein JZ751_004985 [Albula glossodonta]|uniref:UBC core domain-containing protein n=1 Tax=Albula glossodonta TaxID=121402 RepID=A0A8T2PD38_9TELE|nr:hypothetical protein JZ751_004985 [Albula glossodonta]
MENQYNLKSPAVKRLMKEAAELRDPTEHYHAQPLEDNLFEWHFSVRGPPDSDFDGGVYHGRIVLPPEYPMKPPSIILLTPHPSPVTLCALKPNGRFEVGKKICLSISGHHPETWQPSWSNPGPEPSTLTFCSRVIQPLVDELTSFRAHRETSLSDHITIILTPAYTPLLNQAKPVLRNIRVWPEGAIAAFQDCFACIDRCMFWEAATYEQLINLEEYTTSVMAYISKCIDEVTVSKQVTIRANQMMWLTPEICAMLKTCDNVFRTGDKAALRIARAILSCSIRRAKCTYAGMFHRHFQHSGDSHNDASLPDWLKTFYAWLDAMNNEPARKATPSPNDQVPCLSTAEVRNTLSRADTWKTAGPDNIPGRVMITRPQIVCIHNSTSSTITLSTGIPQGCLLNPLLFTLMTRDCTAKHSSNCIIKFVDDTTVVGLLIDNDESAYRAEVNDNNLSTPPCSPATLLCSPLTWTLNTSSPVKKVQLRLYFLWRLKRARLTNVLTSCITVWYGNCNIADRWSLQPIVKAAENIIAVSLPLIWDIYLRRCSSRARNIAADPHHPSCSLCTLLPSDCSTPDQSRSQDFCCEACGCTMRTTLLAPTANSNPSQEDHEAKELARQISFKAEATTSSKASLSQGAGSEASLDSQGEASTSENQDTVETAQPEQADVRRVPLCQCPPPEEPAQAPSVEGVAPPAPSSRPLSPRQRRAQQPRRPAFPPFPAAPHPPQEASHTGSAVLIVVLTLALAALIFRRIYLANEYKFNYEL